MSIIRVSLIVLLVSLNISACFEKENNNHNQSTQLNSTAKYEIKNCVVQLKFLWKNEKTDKVLVIDSVSEAIKKAVSSGKYPRLTANSFEGDSYVFFFSDQCEKRKTFIEDMVSNYLSPTINNLPDYQIIIPDIEDIKKSPTFPRNNWWIK